MQTHFRKPFFYVLTLFCLNGSFSTIYSQNKKEDSLLSVLKTQKDTAQIQTLLKLASIHARDTTKISITYLNKVYALAKPSGEKKYLGDYYLGLGSYKEKQGDPDGAVDNYKNALTMYKAARYFQGQVTALYKNALCHALNGKIRLAIPLFEEAAKKAKEGNILKEEASNIYNVGYAHQSLGETKESINYFQKALEIYSKLNDSSGMARQYNALGSAYHNMSDHMNGIAAFISAKKIFEKLGHQKDYAGCLVNMGLIYQSMRNENKALTNFYEAEKILESIGNKDYLANVRHGIGTILLKNKQYDKALEKFNQAKTVFLEMDNQDYYAFCLISVGEIYLRKGQIAKAIESVEAGLKIKRDLEEQEGVCDGLCQLGDIYAETGKTQLAIANFEEALALSRKIDFKSSELGALKNLADLNSQTGNYKLANKYYVDYSNLKDSIFKTESAGKIAEMEALYKTEKQATEIATLNQQQELQRNQLKVSSLQKNMLLGGLLVLFVIIFLIFNRYRLKQRSNLQLQSAYNEIQVNRDEISFQRKEIMDSIRYAKRIQDAILPSEGQLNKYFAEHFIYYLPKDIVSGDLYWFSKVQDTLMLAAVDCTGHGVPGAFMSVIGVDHLNHIVNEKYVTDPARVLTELDKTIFSSFTKNDENKSIQDGMDVALCSIHLESKILNFAGAHRPLIHIRNNVVTELKATKASIGGYLGEGKIFVNDSLQLQKGDCIYMFTDGYADQFGGPRGKKFKYKQLLDTILANVNEPMELQRQKLVKAFETWKAWPGSVKGGLEQVDDVCVIGVRI
ncbi:MAG: tetratricopeptide repeat protein [Bacteroidia bacterium]|nr:tetratricopeptide repeat protein [Bacteroidia bacterium]